MGLSAEQFDEMLIELVENAELETPDVIGRLEVLKQRLVLGFIEDEIDDELEGEGEGVLVIEKDAEPDEGEGDDEDEEGDEEDEEEEDE